MRLDGRLVLAAAVAACGGSGCNGGVSDLVMDDTNNYTQDSEITFQHLQVQELTDTSIDWSALTIDLRGRPLEEFTVDQVVFSELEMTEDELKDRVLSNDIPQSEATAATFGNSEQRTEVSLSELDLLGNPFDLTALVGDEQHTWVATLLHVPEGTSQQQVLYTVVVEPIADPGGVVTMTDGASTVSVVPDLATPIPLSTAADAGPYTLDWSDLQDDVFGHEFDSTVADTLILLNYPGTVQEVEDDFLLVDYHATEEYMLDVYGYVSANLDEAEDKDGNAFSGFTADGTWLVGLVNSKSLSPLPMAMAVVEIDK